MNKYRIKTKKVNGIILYYAQIKIWIIPFWFWLDRYGNVLWLPHSYEYSYEAKDCINKHKELNNTTYQYY